MNLGHLVEDMDFNAKSVKVCCCSPEIPHNETSKFMIIKRQIEVPQPAILDSRNGNPEDNTDTESIQGDYHGT